MSKAQDRFRTPLNRKQEPAGANYSPKFGMGEDSIFKSSAKAVIGKNNVDILKEKYHIREHA
jgi:hypothetical protein